MIPQVANTLSLRLLPGAEATATGDAVSAFALLMQGLEAGQGGAAEMTLLAASAEGQPDIEVQITLPEDLDLTTPEGLIAALDHTIAALEAAGVPLTAPTVLAAFAGALGETGVETLGDLSAVTVLKNPALAEALEGRIAEALQRPTPLEQLSIAAAGMGVQRGEPGQTAMVAEPGEAQATPAPAATTATAATAERPLRPPRPENALPSTLESVAPTAKVPDAASAALAKLTEAVSAPTTGPDPLPRELPPVQALQSAAPQGPTRAAIPAAPPPPPPPSPDAQLLQHVGQQIRSIDAADSKFRFSLTPYGMGEIEIEILRSDTGRLQIAMTTETASVLNVLRHDRDTLLDALQSRGIPADTADLDFQTFGERGRQGGTQAGDRTLAEPAETNETLDEPAPVTRRIAGTGLLDILT